MHLKILNNDVVKRSMTEVIEVSVSREPSFTKSKDVFESHIYPFLSLAHMKLIITLICIHFF
jgi:hypothetical protein